MRVGIVPASAPRVEAGPGTRILRDGTGAVGAYFAGTGDDLALLRPDRYVMAVTSSVASRPVLEKLGTLVRATDEPAHDVVPGAS